MKTRTPGAAEAFAALLSSLRTDGRLGLADDVAEQVQARAAEASYTLLGIASGAEFSFPTRASAYTVGGYITTGEWPGRR